jgi:hypothetical protein
MKEYSSQKRARLRAAFLKNEEPPVHFRDSNILPICLQVFLFLFVIAGVIIYLFNFNRATFGVLVWWVTAVTVPHVALTAAPIFILDELLLVKTPSVTFPAIQRCTIVT